MPKFLINWQNQLITLLNYPALIYLSMFVRRFSPLQTAVVAGQLAGAWRSLACGQTAGYVIYFRAHYTSLFTIDAMSLIYLPVIIYPRAVKIRHRHRCTRFRAAPPRRLPACSRCNSGLQSLTFQHAYDSFNRVCLFSAQAIYFPSVACPRKYPVKLPGIFAALYFTSRTLCL